MQKRDLLIFLAFTCVASFSVLGIFAWLGGSVEHAAAKPVYILYVFPPGIVALALLGAWRQQPVTQSLGLRWRLSGWYLIAWLMPLLWLAMTMAAVEWLSDVELAWETEGFIALQKPGMQAEEYQRWAEQVRAASVHPIWRLLIQAMMAGVSVSAFLALAEELGWRGFVHHWMARYGPRQPGWRDTLTGLAWGVWQLPLTALGFLYQGFPRLQALLLTLLFAVLISWWLDALRRASQSIFCVAISRGTLMALSALPAMLVRPEDMTRVGFYSLWGGAILLMGLMLWRGTGLSLGASKPDLHVSATHRS